MRGWQVPAYTLPENQKDQAVQRILVRLGLSMDMATLLINDMKDAIDYLIKANSPGKDNTPHAPSAYHH